jgi:hypothetical protein
MSQAGSWKAAFLKWRLVWRIYVGIDDYGRKESSFEQREMLSCDVVLSAYTSANPRTLPRTGMALQCCPRLE